MDSKNYYMAMSDIITATKGIPKATMGSNVTVKNLIT
jgi:hypothetical protein